MKQLCGSLGCLNERYDTDYELRNSELSTYVRPLLQCKLENFKRSFVN